MRNLVLAFVVGLAGLAVGAALVVLAHHVPEIGTSAPAAPGQTAVNLPPTAPPPGAAAPAAGAAPAEAPAPAAAASPPAAPAAPDLPTVDVAPLTVHPIPDDAPPAPTVTLVDRDGRIIKEIKPAAPLSPGYVPSPSAVDGPPGRRYSGFGTVTRRGAAHPQIALGEPSLVPPIPRSAAPTSALFNGAAQPAGGTVLSVDGRFVSLFGVRVADPNDRCGLGPGDNRSCADVARDALAQRLARYPSVACHVPPGQRGQAGAVCTDASGTDLGGFLVAEGYALADTRQSYDYFGAEGVARSFRRGLWRYR